MLGWLTLFGFIFWGIPSIKQSYGHRAPALTDWDRYAKDQLSGLSAKEIRRRHHRGVYSQRETDLN